MKKILPVFFALLTMASAQTTPTVFATGLQNPSKIILTPAGKLLVTECGPMPNSGRLSLIDSSGTRSTLIDGMPSGLAAPDLSPDGENGLALDGRKLYVAIGEGDQHRNGPTQGTIVPNPAGISSPIFSSIVTITFNTDIEKIAAPFSLTAAAQATLADGNTATLTNSAGDQAVLQLLTTFRDVPDPNTIYRNSHPYSLALLNGVLYMADAGKNTVYRVDPTSGRASVVYRFPATKNPLPVGPPVSEAVPTSLAPYGTHLLVSLLRGVPFAPGTSSVMDLDPAAGTAVPFIPFLTSTIDVGYTAPAADGSLTFYALQFSLNMGATPPAPGQLFFASTNGTSGPTASNLVTPTSMAIDSASGAIYITSLATGNVLKLALR